MGSAKFAQYSAYCHLLHTCYRVQMPSKTGHWTHNVRSCGDKVQNNSICTGRRWAWSLTSPRWRPAAGRQIILTHTFPGKLGGPGARQQNMVNIVNTNNTECSAANAGIIVDCIKVLRCCCQKMQSRTQLLSLLLLFY